MMSAQSSDEGRSTFECVDVKFEYINGEIADNGCARFHFDKISCSQGVPCPSYNANKAITFVVRTK